MSITLPPVQRLRKINVSLQTKYKLAGHDWKVGRPHCAVRLRFRGFGLWTLDFGLLAADGVYFPVHSGRIMLTFPHDAFDPGRTS
jgi:hypothetical protein